MTKLIIKKPDGQDGNGITSGENNALDSNRRLPTPQEFALLVTQACEALIEEGKPFTAYSVTKKLKAENPGLELRHQAYANLMGIQVAVHDHAMPFLLQQPQTPHVNESWEDWNGNGARTYTPLKITVASPPAQAVQATPQITPKADGGKMTVFDWQNYSSAGNPLAQQKGIGDLPIPMLTSPDSNDS